MIYYEVGDRVLKGKEPCVIVVIHRSNNRYYIRYLENYNIQGTNVERWIGHNEIELDKQYYRDLKIDRILVNEI